MRSNIESSSPRRTLDLYTRHQPNWTASLQVWTRQSRQNVMKARNRARPNGMGSADCICPEEGCSSTFLCRLLKHNSVPIGDSYAFPKMDECISSLGNARVLSTLDTNSVNLQVEEDEVDRYKLHSPRIAGSTVLSASYSSLKRTWAVPAHY